MQWSSRLVLAAAVFAAGCEPIPPSGDLLAPVRVEAATPRVAAPAEAQAQAGGFDFEGEDRDEDAAAPEAGEADPVELQARLLGVDPAMLRRDQPAPEPAPVAAPVAPPAQPAAPTIGEWDPSAPLPDGSFGVRLLATLVDVQPPRAVIGLPDGSEQVVQPGTFLEAQRLVVMAIGRDVVQVARVVPQGYYARIDTQNLHALFPSQRPSTPQ